ncbi:MAG: peptidylprolyl isomerase [Eubacterium sp.]|nr:peptidylprolyl isomerase [Eubacterium sp.]
MNGGNMNQLELKTGTKAVIKTNLGDMTFILFPEIAPMAVENFTKLSANGYYDGLIFHRIIKDFMIQGGDPTGTGMGGQSIWGHPFKDEFSEEAHNYYGALSMANSGPNTNVSQFFIVHANTAPPQMLNQMEKLSEQGYPEECVENYRRVGGTPWLDFHHTVFGQLIEGKETLEKIACVETEPGDRPVNDVIIDTIEIIA